MCDPREASDDHGQVRGMFYRSTSHPPTIVTIVLGRVVHALALANVSCHYIFSCPVAGTSSWRDAFGVSQNRCDDLNSSTVHVFAFLEAPHALDCGAVVVSDRRFMGTVLLKSFVVCEILARRIIL